jgi:hypothetical protein
MKHTLFIIVLLFSSLHILPLQAQNIQISLLTVAPRDKAVYTIFGHTALRINNIDSGADFVLNWGTFDTDRPNFMYHFVRGETDYFLSAEPYVNFSRHYLSAGASIIEQILNIPNTLKPLFIKEIATNLEPQNVEYRYNYFFDNCTLRPRDLIEKYCGGKMIYPPQNTPITLRDLVHECTAPYPWLHFGIDLVIGSGADSTVSARTGMFLPARLCNALNSAEVVLPDGAVCRIIQNPLPSPNLLPSPKSHTSFLPFLATLAVLAILLALKRLRPVWAIFFLTAALAGSLIAFLVLFSAHPCVSPNWNILWLHPLHFIGFASFIPKKKYRFFSICHIINLAVLSAFLIAFYWIPQEINFACLPLIICLCFGSYYYLRIADK